MIRTERIDLEPAFVLHSRRYRETSLLIEAFGHDSGRLAVVARGALRPKSRMRGLLQPFIPLLISWRGRGELATLTAAEAQGEIVPTQGSATLIGFYVNELLLHFLHRHDPEPDLFETYRRTLQRIALEEDPEPSLRIFEKRLLQATGYALQLEREAKSGARIVPDARYIYRPDSGPEPWDPRRHSGAGISGETLLALSEERLSKRDTLREAKQLMRRVIFAHSGEKTLISRNLWRRRRSSDAA
ncbi:DNA repair protein RecO [Thioalkalivibrio sp. HK1]|uniref:DNA repair protein RecO n=1 Tax=Thioalkalivibrio sp. HK1 TaxID=1469245 RepID=UPI000470D458|nr:DNA repair protein RecO [Thioalkalivibrio sp. HK1]